MAAARVLDLACHDGITMLMTQIDYQACIDIQQSVFLMGMKVATLLTTVVALSRV